MISEIRQRLGKSAERQGLRRPAGKMLADAEKFQATKFEWDDISSTGFANALVYEIASGIKLENPDISVQLSFAYALVENAKHALSKRCGDAYRHNIVRVLSVVKITEQSAILEKARETT